MTAPGRVAVRGTLPVLLAVLAAGCRTEAERRAAELEGLRERATEAVEDLARYCVARDSVVANSERGVGGWEAALVEVLRAPDAVNDYCADRGAHDHETPSTAPDTVLADTAHSSG